MASEFFAFGRTIPDPANIAASYAPTGPGYLFWAVVGSAVAAAVIGLLTIAKTRLIAKKRAALDLILHMHSELIKEGERTFVDLADKKKLEQILALKNDTDVQNQIKVKNYLNALETLAVSIKLNIVDENVCKATIGDALVKRWQQAYPLIAEIRKKEGDEEFFEHFQEIAKRWKDHPTIKQDWWIVAVLKEIFRF